MTKTVIDPPGAASPGGRYRDVPYSGDQPGHDAGDRSVQAGTFLGAEFDFVTANAPDTGRQQLNPYTLGLASPDHPAEAALTFDVRLRADCRAASAANCAQLLVSGGAAITWQAVPPAPGARGALAGKHAVVTQKFTMPGNHVAQLGDWVTFETQWTNIGTGPRAR